jgi:WD40 repeat protein
MLRLVDEGEAAMPVRRRAPLAELELERNEGVADVLATLADSRLVTVGEGSVEVAHEALLREWPRLRDWIEEDTEGRRLRRHITQSATEWNAGGRDKGELYRGARLVAALDWSTDHAFELNELEREFVSESREVSERETKRVRRTNRRLRALLGGVAVLLAAAVAGGILALIQRGQARDAETAQFAQRLGAQALVEEDLDLSLLLARQAVAIDDSPQTRGYLLANLLRFPVVAGVMHGEGDILRSIAVSPDGNTLAIGVTFVGLLFFNAHTYERIGEPLPIWAESVAYSPDGTTLAYGGGGYIRVIDARTRRQLAEAQVKGIVPRMAFTQDGEQLVVLVDDGDCGDTSISVRNAATLAPIGSAIEPEGYAGRYTGSWCLSPAFALTPDGRSVIIASDDDKLVWWDLQTREKTRQRRIGAGRHALALSPDGRTAAVGIDRGIQLVDMRTGAVRTASGVLVGAPSWLVFSRDGRTVVSTGLDGTVTLWDAASATRRDTLRGHSASVQQPVFSPDGRTLYTVSHDGTAIAWDVGRRRGLGRPFTFTRDSDFDENENHPGRFSPDGRLIAVGLKEQGIGLWDTSDLTPAGASLLKTGGEVKALAFSPVRQTLAAVTDEGQATLWDVESRSLRWGPIRVDPKFASGVSFSADGTMLATAGDDGVKLWDAATGARAGSFAEGVPASNVAFSPAGPIVAFVYAQGWKAEVWDVVQRSRIATLRVAANRPGLGSAVAFAPDGRLLATAGLDDPLVHLWEVRTGKLIRELEQNVGGVLGLEFSADGEILAMSGAEAHASLWDVATGREIGPTLTVGSRRAMMDLSSDGRLLLMTNSNGQGAVWDVDPVSWARRACALANRTLTREEWKEFLPRRPYDPACQD